MQDEWYFYLDQGEAKGPIEKDEVLRRIETGQLRSVDLIFNESEGLWRSALEFIEFKECFEVDVSEQPEENNWVLLKKKPDSLRFLQMGPYSEAKIRELIVQGEINNRDFLWEAEKRQWVAPSKIEIFQNLCSQTSGFFLASEERVLSAEDFLAQTERDFDYSKQVSPIESKPLFTVKREPLTIDPVALPPEADPVDLTQPKLVLPEEEVAPAPDFKQEPAPDPKPLSDQSLRSEQAQAIDAREDAKDPAAVSFLDRCLAWVLRYNPRELSFFLLITGCSMAALFNYSSLKQSALDLISLAGWPTSKQDVQGLQPEESSEIKSNNSKALSNKERVAVSPVKPIAKVAPVEPSIEKPGPPKEETQVETRKLPENLKMTIEGAGKPSVALKIQSDGSSHFAIFLSFYSDLGANAEPQAQFRGLKKEWSGKEMRFEIKELNLVPGNYKVRVDQADLSEVRDLRWGSFSANAKGYQKVKKQVASQFNLERKRLIKLSSEFYSLAQSLQNKQSLKNPKWQSEWASWSRWKNWRLLAKNPGQSGFPFDWLQLARDADELNKLQRELVKGPLSRDLQKELDQLVMRMKKLKDASNARSLF